MHVSRRTFLKYVGLSAGALGLDAMDLGLLKKALADPNGPSVVWLHGSSCTGCSVSLLNRISDAVGEPPTITEVLTGAINLIYHPTVMASAGDPAVAALKQVYRNGNYIVVFEGGVPTAFNGYPCMTYSYNGVEVTHMQAVQEFAARAAVIICVGTCASFGGIPAAGSNPTQVVSVHDLTGRPTINISGCPANPDWVVWAIVQLLQGHPVTLDADGRPVDLYAKKLNGAAAPSFIHEKCPRNKDVNSGAPDVATQYGQDGRCLINLGCRGPVTKARCEGGWNGLAEHANWCIGVNAPCQGCTEKTFPGPYSLFEPYPLNS
jgi:hydrogenase small subunit